MSIFSDIFGAATGGLGSVALDTIGGLAEGLFPKMFGAGGSQSEAISQSLRDTANLAPSLTESSMYNAAGYTGGDVRNTFGRQLDSLGNSGQARLAAANLRGLGTQALSNVGTQFENSRQAAQQVQGDMRRDAMSALRSGGASPAAIGATLSGLSDANRQTSSALYGQAAQQYGNALNTAASAQAQASNILGSDLASRNQIYVKPFEAQINQGITALAGDIAGQQASAAASQDALVTAPWAGLATGLGQLGAGYRAQYFDANDQSPMDRIQSAEERARRRSNGFPASSSTFPP